MTDGEAWLDALGAQLRKSETQIPALAAAQAKLAQGDASVVGELQSEVAEWYVALAGAARAVFSARLSRAAPVMANAVAWVAKLREEVSRFEGAIEAEDAPSSPPGATGVQAPAEAEAAPASSEASGSQPRASKSNSKRWQQSWQ